MNFKFKNLITSILISTRPKQWTKNLLIYLPLLFSVNESWQFSDISSFQPLFIKTTIAYIAFCMVTGAVYIINDLLDIKHDKVHPVKSKRPIAATSISPNSAIISAIILFGAGIIIAYFINVQVLAAFLFYIGLMLSYSMILKHHLYVDVLSISIGFIIRALCGALAVNIPVSNWLLVCTGLGALLIAISKRRAELISVQNQPSIQRPILSKYKIDKIDKAIPFIGFTTIIFYTIYAFSAVNLPANNLMLITAPIVGYGIFRYVWIVKINNKGEHPEEIWFKDLHLLSTIVLWAFCSLLVLVLGRT